MLDRIFSHRRVATDQPPVECFECRMVGGTGLTALGGYIIWYSFQRRHKPTTGRASMFVSSFVGSVVMTLGLLRLAGVHELQQSNHHHPHPLHHQSDQPTNQQHD